MKVTIEIDTDNVAFFHASELARILKYAADKVSGYDRRDFKVFHGTPLMDYGGKKVGQITVEE